jgi:hypothetical protein
MLLEARRLNPESPGIARMLGQYHCFTGNDPAADESFSDALAKGDHPERIAIAKGGCTKETFLRAFSDAEAFLR